MICAGKWDTSFIVCTPTIGDAGVGQVTITATSGSVKSTMTLYVHLKVDRVVVNPLSGCTTMGQVVNASASAFSTSAAWMFDGIAMRYHFHCRAHWLQFQRRDDCRDLVRYRADVLLNYE